MTPQTPPKGRGACQSVIYRDALGSVGGVGRPGAGLGGWISLSFPSSVPCIRTHAAAQELRGDALLLGWVCRGQIAQGRAQGGDDAPRICLLELTLKLSGGAVEAAGGGCLSQGCPGTAPSSSSPTPSSTCPPQISSPCCPTALPCPSSRIPAPRRLQLSSLQLQGTQG